MGRAFLVLLVMGAGLSAWALRDLTFDHTTRSLMRRDARADEREEQLARVFGAEDLLFLAWEADVAEKPTFERVSAMTRELAAMDGLERITSLATAPLGLGGPLPRLLNADDFSTPARREAVKRALAAAAIYSGTIYSRELDVVAIATALRPRPPAERRATLARVRALVARYPGTYLSGVTPFAEEAAQYAFADLRRIGLLSFGVAVGVLLLLCRSLRDTLVAVAATGLPPLFALGLAAQLEIPLTALGAALFPVMAVVGITSSVHLLNAIRERGGHSPWRAARRLAPPILLSLATTAVAFFSLQATGVPAFFGAGLVVGIGLCLAMPVILLGIPAALSLLPRLAPRSSRRGLDRALLATGMAVARHPRRAILGGALAALAGAALIPASTMQVQVLQAFQPDSSIAKTYRFLEERLTATVPVDMVLTARDDATDAEILADLRAFSDGARRIDGVADAWGLEGLVDYGRRFVGNDAFALAFLRTSMRDITKHFEDQPGKRYRVKVRIREGTGPKVLDRLAELASRTRSGDASLTGLFLRAVGTTRHLIRDLFRGALLMTLLVVVTVAVALRSLRTGLAVLLPNLLPPLVVFGAAAAAGVPLDVSAVAVGSIAIGLAIDDTLHILFRVRAERLRGRSPRRALLRTMRSVGRALVLSTVVLVAGLGCMLFSSFLPTARFGLFTAGACTIALLADLLVLPAILQVSKSP